MPSGHPLRQRCNKTLYTFFWERGSQLKTTFITALLMSMCHCTENLRTLSLRSILSILGHGDSVHPPVPLPVVIYRVMHRAAIIPNTHSVLRPLIPDLQFGGLAKMGEQVRQQPLRLLAALAYDQLREARIHVQELLSSNGMPLDNVVDRVPELHVRERDAIRLRTIRRTVIDEAISKASHIVNRFQILDFFLHSSPQSLIAFCQRNPKRISTIIWNVDCMQDRKEGWLLLKRLVRVMLVGCVHVLLIIAVFVLALSNRNSFAPALQDRDAFVLFTRFTILETRKHLMRRLFQRAERPGEGQMGLGTEVVLIRKEQNFVLHERSVDRRMNLVLMCYIWRRLGFFIMVKQIAQRKLGISSSIPQSHARADGSRQWRHFEPSIYLWRGECRRRASKTSTT